MFEGFSQKTVDFMWNIRFNNEKIWFEAHRDEYKNFLAQPMNALAADVSAILAQKYPDLNLKTHVSRIYRDARRLHGNGPFKDHFWFSLRQSAEEWTDKPVFWFELSPETWSYGLGYYLAKAITMAKHRARIDNRPQALEKLARTLNRQTEFVLEGNSYARLKGDPGKLLLDWYNKKSFSLIHEQRIDEAIYSADLEARIVEGFDFLVPFYRYFSTLDSDPSPYDND